MIQIEKNTREVIRVDNVSYKDEDYLDIRVWFKTYDSKEFFRSKKGLTIKPDVAMKLVEALNQAIHAYIDSPNGVETPTDGASYEPDEADMERFNSVDSMIV